MKFIKVIIKVCLLLIWNYICIKLYNSQLATYLNDEGTLKYSPIWLLGFANGGIVMQYLIEKDSKKDKFRDYSNQHNNVKSVPPSKMKAPKAPPKQK